MMYYDHLRKTKGIGEEVHKFLDQYFQLYRGDHRLILHHKKGIELVKKLFGEDMGWVAEQHIKDDWDGVIPNDYNDKNFYRVAWAFDIYIFNEAIKKAKEIFERDII